MLTSLQSNRHISRVALVALSILLVSGGLLGCSSDQPGQDEAAPDQPSTEAPGGNQVSGDVLRPAKLVSDEYAKAVTDGSVVNDTKYRNVQSAARKMRKAWDEAESVMKDQLSNETFRATDEAITELVELVENRGPTRTQQQLARSVLDTLSGIGSEIPEPRRGTVRSIERADADIEAETVARDYRVGATLQPAKTIYDGESVASNSEGADHQLRVTLREQRTKRFLPGAEIEAVFQGPAGDEIQSVDLLETLGPYHFYGENLDVPTNAQSLSLRVAPPEVGRHADMKERYIHPATVNFDLTSNDTGVRLQGPEPSPVPDDVTLGGNVPMALEETSDIKTAGPYRVGFIAELSEPFWVFDTYRTGNSDNSFNVRLADIPQSANRHLEIVLFDRKTFRVIPHADVSLHLTSRTEETESRTKLPFLLSAFYHYGNSLYLPSDEYNVEATIDRPDVHTLRENRFPGTSSVSFTWEAKAEDDMESHEHEHSEEDH